MAKYLTLPDGSSFQMKEGQSPADAMQVAIQLYPDAFGFGQAAPTQDTKGFKAAAAAGFERLKGETALTAGKLGLMDTAAAEQYQKEKEAAAQKRFTPTEEGWTEAPFQKFKETLGGSVPYMLAPAAAGLAAVAAPVSAPVAAGLGLVGAGALSAGQFTGTNLARQMDTGKTLEQTSLSSAVGAALPQAALDTAAMALLPGVGKLFGSVGSKLTTEQARAIASQTLGKAAMDYTAKTGLAMGREGLTETVQQVLERVQAGLAIDDPEARKEYIDSFIGGSVLAGAGAPIGRAFERSGAKAQVREADAQEQAKAAAEAEAAKNTPDALRKLSADFSAAEEQRKALQAAVDAAKPKKGSTEEERAKYDELKKARDEFISSTYKPLRQEFTKRKDAIAQLDVDRQTALEVETAAGQEAAKAPIPTDEPKLDVQKLMLEQDTLRQQMSQLESQLGQADPSQFDALNAQRQDLQRRIDARATLIEERGGSPLAQQEFEQATAAKMQALDTKLEQLGSTYKTALENKDYDAAAKAKDGLLSLRQERQELTAKTSQQMQALQEKQTGLTQRGQTRDLFAEAPAPTTTAVDEELKKQTLEEEKARGLYGPASKRESAEQAFGEAAVGPRGQLEPTTPMPDLKAQTGIKPKQLELVGETEEKVSAAETALADAAKAKDTDAIYAAVDALNQAKGETARAQGEVGRGLFRPVVLDLFSPANIINTAIKNNDTKLINDLATHAQTTALRTALDKNLSEREKLVRLLDSRLDLGGDEKASTGERLQSVKRERADLFSQQYDAKQQALFKNGTYPDRELQALYDKGGPSAVEYENVMRAVEELSKKVTAKQGNAKQSLYEQLVDLAAQHERLVAQMESGMAAPTMREKVAGAQAKLGKGETPAAREMDAAEKYQLQRRIDALVNKYRLVEGKIAPVRDQITKLYASLYKTTPLEKPSVIAERKERESRVYRTEVEKGAKPFLAAIEKISEPSTGENGLRQIGNIEVDLKPYKYDENTVYFSLIRALKGADKGEASAVLKQITDLADRHGVTLFLQVEKVGKKGLNEQQLQDWYAKNGFKLGDMGMYRKPQPVQVQKVAVSRTAKTAARIAKGDVRKEAETSQKMRDLARDLGTEEADFKKFEKEQTTRYAKLKEKYGRFDPAVVEFQRSMAEALNDKAIEIGKKTPEYKATLKEQIEYVKGALSQSKQTIPTKRTGQVTRKQTAAPRRLVSSSPESRAESEAEALRLKRRAFKEAQEALDSEKTGTAYRLKEGDADTVVDAAEAQKVIDGLNLPDNVKFVYAPTARQVPIKLLNLMAKDGIDAVDGVVRGAVFPDGTVLVVGDQHANVKDLEETIAHELIGHYGVDTVIGMDQLNAFAKKTDVIALAEQLGGKELVSEVLSTVKANAALGRSEEVQKLQALREIIAHTEEARVTEAFREKAGRWLKELVGMVRAGLRKLGLKNMAALSTSDVFYMLKQSRKEFANKTIGPYRSADGGVAFRLRKEPSPYTTIGAEPSAANQLVGNLMGLAGRVQYVDQYAALDAATKKGLSAGVISGLEATNINYLLRFGQQRSQFAGQFLTNGPVKAEHVKKNGGVETIYRSTKGTSMVDVAQALNKAKIGTDTEQEAMFTLYMAGKRASQVGWNKLNVKDPAKAQAEYNDVMARLDANPTAKKAFEEAAKLYKEYNAGLMDFLVDTGALSAKKAAELKAIDYVPFYRINGNGEVQLMIDKERPVRIANIKDQPQLKELVGGNDAILPIFTSAAQNTFMVTGMGLRNQAVKETSFMLQKLGIASRVSAGNGPAGDNVVRFMKNGEQYYALVDTDAYGIPAELIVRGMEGIKTTLPAVIKLLGIPANILRSFVVRNPTYAVRQIIRDPLNAWLTTGTDATPILSSMKELASMVAGRSDAERKLMETGAISSNVYSGDEQDMAKFLKDMSAGKSGWDKAVAKLDTFALQGDAATRAVIYKDSLAKGMTEQEALLRTLESMNFSRRGVSPSMQALSTLIPFFNAQIQGLDVIYRAFKGDMPYSQQLDIRAKMLRRGLLMAAGTVAYAMMMEDDEAYKRAKPEERLANWFVYVPGIDEPVRVPIPFEMGFLFKALPEAVYNMATQDDKAGAAVSGLSKLALQTVPLSLPQAVKPLTEAMLGKSFYSGDIESTREKNVLATQRYRDNSTEVAKTIGAVTGNVGISPITIDYLIRGYTGGLGVALVQLANPLLASDTKADVAQPTTKISKTPFIGGLFQPVEGRGTLDEAYDRMKEIQQVKGTFNDLVEKGKRAEAMAFAQEYSEKLAAASISGSVQKRLGELAALERQVKASPTLTTEQKDAQLERLDKLKVALATQLLTVSNQR